MTEQTIPFERRRSRWATLTARRVAPGPPVAADATTMAEVHAGLTSLMKRDPSRFDATFLRGAPLRTKRAGKALLQWLRSLGIVTSLTPWWVVPCVRLTGIQDRWIATDLPAYRRADQVFAIMFEQVYVIRNLEVRPEEELLELCSGSGVLSLFASDDTRHATAVELSPRALSFARFNLALNGAADRVQLLGGSLYDPLPADRRFDHIVVNPPFEPVPPGLPWFRHSAGGEDGLAVVRQVLDGVRRHLHPEGRLSMVTWSPGDAAGPVLPQLVREALPAHGVRLDVLDRGPIAPLLQRFRKAAGYERWRARIEGRGLTHTWSVFLHAAPTRRPGVTVRHPQAELDACHAVADAWP